jgi:hypothetical protein
MVVWPTCQETGPEASLPRGVLCLGSHPVLSKPQCPRLRNGRRLEAPQSGCSDLVWVLCQSSSADVTIIASWPSWATLSSSWSPSL